MFYACIAILILIIIICTCTIMAAIDLETYNFGLYIILLCIVGTMIACALCVASPHACKNPAWYTKFCLLLQELHPEHMRRGSSAQGMDHVTLLTSNHAAGAEKDSIQVRAGNRATIAMLAPAVHIMHHVWKGMAWVTEDFSEEDDRITSSRVEVSTSEHSLRKLSIIIESSANQLSTAVQEETSSGWDSSNDVTL